MGGGVYDLTRFASSCNVRGGFSKMLTYFSRNYNWSEIYTFADRRWSVGDLYLKCGFKIDKILKPDYRYIIGDERKHKFGFRHNRLEKILESYDPSLTEHENCLNNNIHRIYDCGLIRFVVKNTK